jgi:HK97 family phage major capsid protein
MSTASEMLSRLIAKQDEARAARDDLQSKRSAIVQLADDEGRSDLNDTEDSEFQSLTGELRDLDGQIETRAARITELSDEEQRTSDAAVAFRQAEMAGTRVKVNSEARTYEQGNGRSYFQDLAKSQINGDPEARTRLERHASEVLIDPEYRDLNRTDTSGGYFVPPLWLAEYVELARAGRPTANLVTNLELPPGTDSINIPKIGTGTATAIQAADNTAVQETDLADTTVQANVKTIAGQQDLAIQLMDQSPFNFDQVVFADLAADYATKVNVQVLSGSNAAGQVKGILTNTTSLNTVAYTDTTATVAELYPKVADAIQKIHTTRFLAPNVIVMHPRRWAWMLAALDSTNRPLVVPLAQGPNNAFAGMGEVASQGVVGTFQGLPVVVDPSIPTTDGAGTNEDVIIVMRSQDCILYESSLRTRVLPEVGSGTLTVRLQVYGYIAFTGERQPKGISVVSGTGLTAPTF